MKKLLILSGPQGSGNHMWSKIFALHPAVFGWSALLDEYWIGHDREPFSDCWRDTSQLKNFDWSQRDYYVTSISVPYMENGTPTVPDICAFRDTCGEIRVKTNLAIIGRDRNILHHQETRLRGGETYQQAIDLYETLLPDYYLSYELLQLYRQQYLVTLSRQMDFPIAFDLPEIDTIIGEDTNNKYFHPVDNHWVDDLARKTSAKWR